MDKKKIILTGGAGYIGSHIALSLVKKNYEPIIIDNLTNSNITVIKNIEKICRKKIIFFQNDVNDYESIYRILKKLKIYAVIHLAAYKSIPESIEMPLKYFYNNVNSLISILGVMKKINCNKIIFSSSCSVYGEKIKIPVNEQTPLSGNNPYAMSKIMCEDILAKEANANENLQFLSLRYFNPIGSHPSGLLIEKSDSKIKSLINEICDVANKESKYLKIFGNDHKTKDGTCVRDYIHIDDLSLGHIAALENLSNKINQSINLGTGKGYSIFDVIMAFEKVNKVKIPYKISKRRKGDLSKIYADVSLSKKILNWTAKEGLESMCSSAWFGKHK